MKRTRWSIPALGAFFVAVALAVSACGSSGVGSDNVASVAGNPISTKTFNHFLYVALKGQAAQSPGSPVIVPDPPNYTNCIASAKKAFPQLKKEKDSQIKTTCQGLFTQSSSQVMSFLIQAYWYQALAHREGINVTDAQVQSALTKAKTQRFGKNPNAQFTAYLKQTGYTNDDLEYQFRVSQVFQALIKKQPTTVTDAQITAYYNVHKSQFGTPERRSMRIVLAKTQAQANAARSALNGGQSWNAVAKKYSQDPTTKNKGGFLPDVTAGQQDAALSKAAFAAKVNKLVGPVKGQFGYYVIEVTKITPAVTKSLAQSKTAVKQTLTQQKSQAAQTAVDSAAKKAFMSKTKCKKIYSMADCAGYKAPKTSSTTAAPQPTPQSSTTAAPSSSASSSTTTSATSSK